MVSMADLKKLKWGDYLIPYTSIEVVGELRDYVHEYPGVNGGSAEKLGRKLYTVNVKARFDVAIGGEYKKAWPDGIWPAAINYLFADFELGITQPTDLPAVGTVPMYCTNWTRLLDVKCRSGEEVTLKFREDQDSSAFTLNILKIPTTALPQRLGDFEGKMPPKGPSLFDKIRDGVNSILAIRDTAQMWRGVLIAKIEAVRALFEEADATLDELKGAGNAELIRAFQRLWESVVDLGENITGIGKLLTYVLPADMSAVEVSKTLYGNSTMATDIVELNNVEDASLIPAGKTIKYFGS